MRAILRKIYTSVISLKVIWGVIFKRRKSAEVCFCGAQEGSSGGPLVKSSLLISEFGQSYTNFGALYTFSGMPYLSSKVLRLAKKRGIPIVHNQNGVFYKAWYDVGWEKRNLEMLNFYRAADVILFQSKFCYRAASKFLGESSAEKVLLYNSVDTTIFRPREVEHRNDKFTFLIASKIGKRMGRLRGAIIGLKYAIRAGLQCRLIIAGPMHDSVHRQVRELVYNLNLHKYVEIYGAYSRQMAPVLFSSADAFISLNYNDSCPNSILEALASGLPIIYSNTGGTPELVSHDCGVALDCEQSWELICFPADELVGPAMLEVANNLEKMKIACRERAINNYELQHWLKAHREIFRKVMI